MYSLITQALRNKGYIVTKNINQPWIITRSDDSVWQLRCRSLKQAYEMILVLNK